MGLTLCDSGTKNCWGYGANGWVLIGNLTGPAGPTGATGPAGPAGSGPAWYTGTATPTTLHNLGDFYLQTTTGNLYQQVAGTPNTWSLVCTLGGGSGGNSPFPLPVVQVTTNDATLAANTCSVVAAANALLPGVGSGSGQVPVGTVIQVVHNNGNAGVYVVAPSGVKIADSSVAGDVHDTTPAESGWANITLQAVSATQWIIMGGDGTWTTE